MTELKVSSAVALLPQLEALPGEAALDQLVDLQRRHSVLRNILRLSMEDLPSSPPQIKPRVPSGQPAAQAEPLRSLHSPAGTPRRPQTLPPLETRGRSGETPRLGHSQSRGRALSRTSSQGGRPSRASSRASNASNVSRRSRVSDASRVSRISHVSRASRVSNRARSVDGRRLPKRSSSVQSLQSRISALAINTKQTGSKETLSQ